MQIRLSEYMVPDYLADTIEQVHGACLLRRMVEQVHGVRLPYRYGGASTWCPLTLQIRWSEYMYIVSAYLADTVQLSEHIVPA